MKIFDPKSILHVSTFPVSRRSQTAWKRKFFLENRSNTWFIKKNYVSSFHGNGRGKEGIFEKYNILKSAESLTFSVLGVTFPVSTFPLYFVEEVFWKQPPLDKIKMLTKKGS